MAEREPRDEDLPFPERATYGCTTCGSINHTTGMSLCNGTRYALVACFPGCEWNGEVPVDTMGHWSCPGCGEHRRFRPARRQSGSREADNAR